MVAQPGDEDGFIFGDHEDPETIRGLSLQFSEHICYAEAGYVAAYERQVGEQVAEAIRMRKVSENFICQHRHAAAWTLPGTSKQRPVSSSLT